MMKGWEHNFNTSLEKGYKPANKARKQYNTIQEKILATKELVHGESKKIHVKDCSQMTSSIF